MPRLPPALLHRAHGISPHLRTLLPACRDLESAQNELRWIRQHVSSHPHHQAPASRSGNSVLDEVSDEQSIARLCARRGAGEPLQYVLGSQPFGRLDIRCRKGVLIPRPETEAYVVHLAGLIRRGDFPGLGGRDGKGDLRVLDLCTGTGCIALLLYEQLCRKFPGLHAAGLDVSPSAVALARENLGENVRRGLMPDRALASRGISFERADIFHDGFNESIPAGRADILLSNPPYISTKGFNQDTGRSVRTFEPKLALVPDETLRAAAASMGCEPEDVFYARLFDIAQVLRPKVMLFEVGDMEQAKRVVQMATRMGRSDEFGYEIWRDEPAAAEPETSKLGPGGSDLTIRGEGHGRSVLVYRKVGVA